MDMKCENVERILLSREDLDRITKNLGADLMGMWSFPAKWTL